MQATPGIADPTPVAMDVTNGNSVPNNGRTFIRVKNTNSGSTARTLTTQIPFTIDGQSVTPHQDVLAAGATRWLGPFRTNIYSATLQLNADHVELQITAFSLPS